MSAHSNYELLIQKLDQFIRKYYTNKIIRGSLYTVGAVIMLFLVFNSLEYYFFFSTGVRKLLFFGFIFATIGMLAAWVISPLLKYFHLGDTISHEQAAHIIGDHFSDVKDKLLNVLQLKKQAENSSDRSLIEASINQKTSTIKVVPFKNAIDLSKNKQYLKYALPPFLLLLVLLFAAPSLIKDGAHRIINNDKEFEREAPFSFAIENKDLKAVQFEDFTLDVVTEGEVSPQEAFIEVNDFQYRLKKVEPGKFSYTFKNVQKESTFKIFSGDVSTAEQTLEVLVKPNLANMDIDLDYPSYTGRRDESISNTGDLVIPEGTRIRWNVNALNADEVSFSFNGNQAEASTRQGQELFYLDKRIKSNQSYKIYIANEAVPVPDSVRYAINVIKDQFPTINVERYTDSLDQTLFYFLGSASDDYGLKELTFNYAVSSEEATPESGMKVIPLTIAKGRSTNYDYVFDVATLELEPGEKVSYFFEVKDNDLINGSKSARTGLMTFEKPSLEELKKQENENEEKIKTDLEEAIKESRKMQEDLKKMREKMLQKKELNWQDKKELEKLLEQQKEMQEKLQDAQEKFQENMETQKEMNQDEEQMEKQEKLQEMFEELMDPESQELMEKIQELMQELDKEDMIQMMEDMEMSEEVQKKNMERLLELYKQLEMEKEIQDQAEKLEELAEKQEELSEETKEGEKSQEELQEEQKEIQEEFEEVKEKMEELEEKNEELSPPKDLSEDNDEKMDEISEDMDQSQQQMEKQDNEGASKSQKNASEKMKEMSNSLMQQMQGGDQEQMAEDLKALRQLLENLVTLSFDQEDLSNELLRTISSTPRYVELLQDQFKLKNDFQLIQDSLDALAARQIAIESFVAEKTAEIRRNMDESLDELEERLVPEANESQRRTMKNVNDLALILSDNMEQMQQQMAGMMSGSQMCDKPGGQGQGQKGDVPMDKITEGQQGVGEKLGEMQGKQQSGEGLSSKDFAEAAARQAALRKALQDMRDAKGEQGKGGKELQEIIDEMDKIEEDLVNKRLDNEMFMRQQEILTRLLEAEKAEQQREYDNKRKAEIAQEKRRELPPALQDYLKKRESEIEMYKTVSPDLKPYYKFLVDQYYRALKGEK
ncbi:MAG: DUF4175 domain-containing protein [Saprospiraceae bacterium]|nr:DUF4175 domain-containing protein [Saprospiraceae bacterium]